MKIDIEKYYNKQEITKNCAKCNDDELLEKELIDIANETQENEFNIEMAKYHLDETKKYLENLVSGILKEGSEKINAQNPHSHVKLDIIRRYILIKDVEF